MFFFDLWKRGICSGVEEIRNVFEEHLRTFKFNLIDILVEKSVITTQLNSQILLYLTVQILDLKLNVDCGLLILFFPHNSRIITFLKLLDDDFWFES
jgi:hypothetical protein